MARLSIATPADVRVLKKGLSVGEALAGFTAAHPDAGGVASFVGKVRPGEDVKALELTHYEPLTLAGMQDLAAQALERFSLDGLLAWHRVGMMRPGEAIVLVAAAARHRRGAFEAVDFAMDHLKGAAWFWKRERRGSGEEGGWHWIEPRDADHADRARWDNS
ncbi:molybdenum cofactor biosynthesis protein MoaE [Erythrobacter sp. LQ02-29]|uniref:molybdenum cofactor biosynthesis protein MoaE n=1 Tax=Erythrobacter sp. LQ02-29 TaxID=2920384 RepID=UPI001F4DD75C|nr:molybdenum cofactor biosynthesis protein MoaE [Erythrobacter sp. LQ02-29]